jgi:hypothetical protein
MAHQEASSVAAEHLRVATRSPLKGTGFVAVAAGAVPVSAIRPNQEIDNR